MNLMRTTPGSKSPKWRSMGPEHEGRSSGESIWPEIKNNEVEPGWTFKKYSVYNFVLDTTRAYTK